MQEKERDELLYRLDERTMRIEDNFGEIEKIMNRHDKEIDELDTRVQNNEMKLKGGAILVGGIFSTVLAVLGKLAGIIRL